MKNIFAQYVELFMALRDFANNFKLLSWSQCLPNLRSSNTRLVSVDLLANKLQIVVKLF